MTTVRGITSRVDIVWSSDGVHLKTIYGVTINMLGQSNAIYSANYTIPLLRSTDDGRVYQCDVVINTSPPIMATDSVTLDVTGLYAVICETDVTLIFCVVPTAEVSTVPFNSIQGAIVGSPQEIHCTVSTVSGVELNSVMISWIGPGGDTITNSSRVTISKTTSIRNYFISTLEFTYLTEEDEGIYTCNVMILETNGSDYITIQNLTGKLHKIVV